MRIRSLLLFYVVLVLLLVAGCSQDTALTTDTASDQTVDQVVEAEATDPVMQPEETHPSENGVSETIASVNNMPITTDDFETAKRQVISQYQQIYSQFGQDVSALLVGAQGRLLELRIEDEALEMATTRALVIGELNRRDASVSEDEVEAEFQRQYAEFLDVFGISETEFKEGFETGGVDGFQTGDLTFDQFIDFAKRTVREEFEIQAIQRLIAGTIEYSEEELASFFGERRSEYDIVEQVRAAHILVETEELAKQLLDELAAGADFAALAREHSIDTGSGQRGGDLGWFERGQMVESFEEAAFSIPVGDLSDIVQTQYGYHLIWVTDYQAEEKPEYEDVVDRVISDFEAEIMAQRFNQWYAVARSIADISIEDLMLDAFRMQQFDVDKGLQAFLKLRDEDLTDDVYIDYIIAAIYETKMDEAKMAKRDIEGSETIAPNQQEQIDELEAEIETNRTLALVSYRAALARFEDNAEIEERIRVLDPEVTPPTE